MGLALGLQQAIPQAGCIIYLCIRPHLIYFSMVFLLETNEKSAYSTDFYPKALQVLSLFLIFHMAPDKISIVKRK